jgi:hypothetical protein
LRNCPPELRERKRPVWAPEVLVHLADEVVLRRHPHRDRRRGHGECDCDRDQQSDA